MQQTLPTFVIRNPYEITRTRIDCNSKEAHLDSIRLTYGIQATKAKRTRERWITQPHHFRVANERVGVLHLRIDLQPAS